MQAATWADVILSLHDPERRRSTLTAPEFEALSRERKALYLLITNDEPMTPKQLGDKMGVTARAARDIFYQMRGRKWVTRSDDQDDYVVVLTEEGRRQAIF